MNLERIQQMKPVIAALAWCVCTHRVSVADVDLAKSIKGTPVWETLTADERQWVDMLIGANLSTAETRDAVTSLLVSELQEV